MLSKIITFSTLAFATVEAQRQKIRAGCKAEGDVLKAKVNFFQGCEADSTTVSFAEGRFADRTLAQSVSVQVQDEDPSTAGVSAAGQSLGEWANLRGRFAYNG